MRISFVIWALTLMLGCDAKPQENKNSEQLPPPFHAETEMSWQGESVHVEIASWRDSCYQIIAEFDSSGRTAKWNLPYPVYHFAVGDVNYDGEDDMMIGVMKRTRFDPVVRRRLFLFQFKNHRIAPLWLGSRLSQPLYSFAPHCPSDSCHVRTIEYEQSGQFLLAEYEWSGFGLVLTQYLEREIPLSVAEELLY